MDVFWIVALEWGRDSDIFVAESRGQAHAMFCSEYGYKWTDRKSIHKIASNVNLSPGRIPDNDDNPAVADLLKKTGFIMIGKSNGT